MNQTFRAPGSALCGLIVTILFWLCGISMAADPALAIEVGENGHYSKLSLTYFPSDELFDLAGNRRSFGFGGESRFGSLTAEYRYGISDRLNLGFAVPWVSNSFDNDFGSDTREGLQDLTLVAEYRFLYFERARRVLSLRAEVIVPTGYETGQPRLWLGNGTTDLLVGGTFKQFFLRGELDRFWYEVDMAVKRALNENRANLDGRWALPVRLGLNYRPRYRYTLAGALVGSFNDRREYLGAEAFVKLRVSGPGELEIGVTEIFRGENSSAGKIFSLGFLVNSGRIWQ